MGETRAWRDFALVVARPSASSLDLARLREREPLPVDIAWFGHLKRVVGKLRSASSSRKRADNVYDNNDFDRNLHGRFPSAYNTAEDNMYVIYPRTVKFPRAVRTKEDDFYVEYTPTRTKN